jgi:hypothetical protein
MDWIGGMVNPMQLRREDGKAEKETQLGAAAGRSVEQQVKQKEDSRAHQLRLARDFTRPVIVMCGAGGRDWRWERDTEKKPRPRGIRWNGGGKRDKSSRPWIWIQKPRPQVYS